MKRIFFLFIAIFFAITLLSIPSFAYAEDNVKYEINSNYTSVFSDCDLNSDIIATLKLHDKVELEQEGSFAKVYTDSNFNFYRIIAPSKSTGFVLCDLVSICNETITYIPNFNAKTNKDCKVFEKTDSGFVETQRALQKNTEIFLYEGFDKNQEYCAICYVCENQVLYDYLKTEDINPKGINPLIIICLTLILALVSLLTLLLFMKRRKIKLKKVGI